MKKMRNFMAMMAAIVLSVVAKAQDAGTYIDSLNVQDSSYMQPLETATEETSSGNTAIIVVLAIVLVVVIAFVVLKKKKK
ncbi:MAG: LPXTG cell wall anchor domain-containing protein [Draconibacterium sp.]